MSTNYLRQYIFSVAPGNYPSMGDLDIVEADWQNPFHGRTTRRIPFWEPMMDDFSKVSNSELLQIIAHALGELRFRGVIRSSNNPVADYTEGLVAKALSLKLAPGSTTGYDGLDSEGRKYEIKGRRLTKHNRRTQMSAIRGLDHKHFEFLVGVLFKEDFSVLSACVIPYDLVVKLAKYQKHVNGWILFLRPEVWQHQGVQDVTGCVRAAQN